MEIMHVFRKTCDRKMAYLLRVVIKEKENQTRLSGLLLHSLYTGLPF